MEDSLDPGLLAFLAGVVFISLSGVVMPGPMFAVTMARGQNHPLAGLFISLGHGVVEVPLILVIYLGLGRFFTLPSWKLAVGLLGGVALIALGVDMYRSRRDPPAAAVELPYTTVKAGIMTSAANPYFFLWWATIGAALVFRAAAWGAAGLVAFIAVHWSCDFGWSVLVSALSYRAGQVWSERVHRLVFACCGAALVLFGGWFIWGALKP